MENVAHATARKTRCVAVRSRKLHLSQGTKTKRLFKSSIILPAKANFSSNLWSVSYVNYSMWENQKHQLI